MSASFPSGTRKTAEESRKAMATQLKPTAPRENSLLMAGRAILMDAPRKGFIKEVMMMRGRRRGLFSFLLIGSKYSELLGSGLQVIWSPVPLDRCDPDAPGCKDKFLV